MYTCIELNAHALVKKILIEDSSKDNFRCDRNQIFFPNLLASQPCESTFRQVRSFTSTFSTVVNCNMLEIIHRIKKIQLQNDIINASNEKIKFPRFEKKIAIAECSKDQYQFESLTRALIIVEIENAKKAVMNDLANLGIDSSKLNFHCQVQPVFEKDMDDMDDSHDIDSDLESDSEEELDMSSRRTDQLKTDNEDDSGCGIEDFQEDLCNLSGTATLKKCHFLFHCIFFLLA